MSKTANDTVREASASTEGSPSHTELPGEPRPAPYDLPIEPVVVIKPGRSWVALNLRDAWSYRELLYFLIWRDIKVRYKQTLLGASWAIIQPLVTMIVFTYFFGKLARVPTEGVPYPIFFYTGLLVWTYFSNALISGANSLVGNANLITKVYFPRLIIPSAAVLAGLFDFAIASTLLAGMLIHYDFAVTMRYLMLPPLVALATALALGFAVWLSALNVRYRDVRYALSFMVQIWLFISPVIYPSSFVPDEWRWVMVLNPMTGIVEGFRASLFGKPFQWFPLGYSAVFAMVLLVYSAYEFRRMERNFAELI
jgi:homopolymeric O-antigen transport system permease protein